MRHAKAKSLSVSVQALDNNLVLTVADDGIGIEVQARQSGLANLRKRAEELGGTFEIGRRAPSGTRAKWSVPVRPRSA
jgi:signal transduction histidine kinase